ncbi:MAG: hypothetical protein LBD96_08680, partial [Treponema sp.]|nr:hypothetical protein [Treponema sp.]
MTNTPPLHLTISPTAWHPAFVQAFQLELEQYRTVLEFIPEFQLTSEPLRIDLAVIRKLKDVPIEKNIAAIFRSDNLVEYKSPDDHLSVEDFYKMYGCACLYASMKKLAIREITMSFVVSRKPVKLLKHLQEARKYRIRVESPGICQVEGDIVPIQIIDRRELAVEENLWLKGLGKDLEAAAMAAILKGSSEKLGEMEIKAYLDVILRRNVEIFMEVG